MVDKVIYQDWLISKGQPAVKLENSQQAGLVGDVRQQPDCIFTDEG